jgi:hypothetical protein
VLKRSATVMMLLITVILPLSFTPSAQSATGHGELARPPGHGGARPTLPDTRGAGDRQAVLIGVPGLTWADLSPAKSPNLWRLAAGGSIASLSVRTVGTWTCPMDGWLTVSAGTRAAYPRMPCGTLPADPERRDGGWYAAAVPAARQVNMASNFRAAVGSLGDVVHQAGGTVLAVGPGAAVAAADSKGRLDEYAPALSAVTDWSRSRVAVVDIENVVRPYLGSGVSPHRARKVDDGARAAAVAQADQEVGKVLAALPRSANVLVAGLSDQSDVPHLRVAIGQGPGFAAGHYLRSHSTRRDGMTILPDVTATVLAAAGLQVPAQVLGIPWTTGRPQGAAPAAAEELRGQDVAAQTLRATLPGFFLVFVVCQLLVYAVATIALRGAHGTGRRRVLTVARVFALASAAVPAATYLVNLLPWWRTGQPGPALFAGVLAWDVVLVAVALGGPWRRDLMIPGTIVAGVTALVSASDLLRGSPLQLNSLMGYSPLVGGRYYGLGNIAFATFATGTLFLAAGIAHLLLRRGHRGWAVAAVILLGATADVLSGSPGLGAKFGGTIALVPGTAVTALIVAGKRVTPLRVLLFAGLGVATIVTICTLDYRRPPGQRTHLGRFADQVVHGEAVPVVTRKMLAMLHTVGNIPLTLLVAGGLLFLFFVLVRTNGASGPLAETYQRAPALRAGLTGTLVTSMSGFAVEDSGIAVPAIALTLSVPLVFAATARSRRLSLDRPAGAPPAGVRPTVVSHRFGVTDSSGS